MTVQLGTKIRELRKRDSRTQENLADALGVTCQAVSRWEQNATFPDMNLIPAIANYFGVTIDELFGYANDRERRVDEIIHRVNALDYENLGNDITFDEGIRILREALAEFPGNEKLTLRLGCLLNDAGWARHISLPRDQRYDNEGYIRYSSDSERKNTEWCEAVKLLEHLAETSSDSEIIHTAITNLVCIYRVQGNSDKALQITERLPKISQSREILRADGTDGKLQSQYLGESLLALTYSYAEQMMYALVNNRNLYTTDLPIEKVKGLIELYHLTCEDGNFGPYHSHIAWLYLYLSRVQWERGYHDDAFVSLDNALNHALKSDAAQSIDKAFYTSALLKNTPLDCTGWNPKKLAPRLPEDWPMWCNPDYTAVKAAITADPRWDAWVSRCRSSAE